MREGYGRTAASGMVGCGCTPDCCEGGPAVTVVGATAATAAALGYDAMSSNSNMKRMVRKYGLLGQSADDCGREVRRERGRTG